MVQVGVPYYYCPYLVSPTHFIKNQIIRQSAYFSKVLLIVYLTLVFWVCFLYFNHRGEKYPCIKNKDIIPDLYSSHVLTDFLKSTYSTNFHSKDTSGFFCKLPFNFHYYVLFSLFQRYLER